MTSEPAFLDYVLGIATKNLRLFDDKDPRIDGSIAGEDLPYDAGFKFRTAVQGVIRAIRAWIPATDDINQSHKARLWDVETQQLLAEAEFTNIVGDSWNEVTLSTPITIEPNKIYLVSTEILKRLPRAGFFFNNPFTKDAITVLGASESNNGIFAYYAPGYNDRATQYPAFPSFSFQNSYYYQDIVFDASAETETIRVREHVTTHPIFLENLKEGTQGWDDINYAQNLEIAAFLSSESINKGEFIDVKASLAVAGNIKIEVFRLGYYSGVGARLVYSVDDIAVITQSTEIVNPATKLVRFNWLTTYTLQTNATWITGCYLVKLTDKSTGKQCLSFFVLRDDNLQSDILYKFGFSTHYAYNSFAYNASNRYSAYSGGERSLSISLDRPWEGNTYNPSTPNSNPLRWEYQTIRWLEKNAYRVSYCSGQDIDKNGSGYVKKYSAFMISGHDEYWSFKEYKAIKEAIESGVSVLSLSANTCYWNIKWSSDYRTAVIHKRNEYLAGGVVSNYQPDTLNVPPTYRFRDPELFGKTIDGCTITAELGLLGVGYIGDTNNLYGGYSLQIKKDDSVLRGTNLKAGDQMPLLVGYEWDHIDPDPSAQPQTKTGTPSFVDSIIFESTITDPIPDSSNVSQSFIGDLPLSAVQTAQGVYFTAPSGAKVFSAGSLQTSWGLDSWKVSPSRESKPYQRIIYNILEDMAVWPGFEPPQSS
ncbi:Ig domain protein group 1 domain protein [Nostoc sp. NIES-4103]|nr:Ig domain protein group 1 domain protein [Nostoc sp. NIES-4103]